jgi:chromosome segregation ATPase
MNAISVSEDKPKESRFTLAGVAAVVLGAALVFGNIYLLNKTDRLETQLRDLRGAVRTELTNLQHDTLASTSENSKALAELRQLLDETGSRNKQAATQATLLAKRYSDQLAKKIELQEKQVSEQHQQLVAQLGEITQTTSQTDQKVSGIATEVTGVKSDVAETRSALDKTLGDLRSVRGDLGVQSGLIATNAKELAALKALGERNYFEFQLPKTKSPQRIGDVAVQLKKSDTKRNRYTIELITNDKRVEKKDRTINEPVQFYMAKARVPYEIVVNEVQRDRIIGYLAAPKVRDMR